MQSVLTALSVAVRAYCTQSVVTHALGVYLFHARVNHPSVKFVSHPLVGLWDSAHIFCSNIARYSALF